jgi:tetratricopeptide (TPR) repeat protein
MTSATIKSCVFLLTGFVLVLGGCGSMPQSAALLKTPPANIPATVELMATPFFPQREFHCGPAALATILAGQDVGVTPDELAKLVYVPEREGSFQIEMAAAARSYGRLVYPLNPELLDILEEVAAGHPVLVFQNLGILGFPIWHFAVVVGYELESAQLWLRSGTEERHELSFSLFERTWRDGGFWARVIVPPSRLPATANPVAVVKSAQDLQLTGQYRAALQAYQAAAARWPESTLVWLGLGNSAYQLAQYKSASDAFKKLVALEPDNFEGWNNLAYALAQQACSTATVSAQCAVQQVPDQDQAVVESTLLDVQAILSDKSVNMPSDPSICAMPACPLE